MNQTPHMELYSHFQDVEVGGYQCQFCGDKHCVLYKGEVINNGTDYFYRGYWFCECCEHKYPDHLDRISSNGKYVGVEEGRKFWQGQ